MTTIATTEQRGESTDGTTASTSYVYLRPNLSCLLIVPLRLGLVVQAVPHIHQASEAVLGDSAASANVLLAPHWYGAGDVDSTGRLARVPSLSLNRLVVSLVLGSCWLTFFTDTYSGISQCGLDEIPLLPNV